MNGNCPGPSSQWRPMLLSYPGTHSEQSRHWVAPGTYTVISVSRKMLPKKCQLDPELGKKFLEDAQKQEEGERRGRERAAAEAAENSEMSQAECPAQESLELGARTPILGEHQAAHSRAIVQVSKSPDCTLAQTYAIPLLPVTCTTRPHFGVWL